MRSVAELAIGREVRCRGTWCGTVTFVVWDPSRGKATSLVVQPDGDAPARLVPVHRAFPAPDWIEFAGAPGDFQQLEVVDPALFRPDGAAGRQDRSDHVLIPAGIAGPAREPLEAGLQAA